MSIDSYLIPDTDVLRNLLGIKDASKLERAETALSTHRITQLEDGSVRLQGQWDIAHLQAIHRHIFQDVYDWAGQFRTVAMSKGTDFHPLPQMAYAQDIFARLKTDDHLAGLDRDIFIEKVSQYQSEIFALHPFRPAPIA